MKLSIIAAIAALIFAPLAFAGGNSQPGDTWSGHGAFSSASDTFAGAKSKVIGNGFSFQSSWAHAAGNAGVTFETDFDSHNASVSSWSNDEAYSGSFGNSWGNTPASDNFTAGFATADSGAWTNGAFDSNVGFNTDGWDDGNNGHGNDPDHKDDSNPEWDD